MYLSFQADRNYCTEGGNHRIPGGGGGGGVPHTQDSLKPVHLVKSDGTCFPMRFK